MKDFLDEWDTVIGLKNLPKFLGGLDTTEIPSGGNVKKMMAEKGINPEKVSIARRAEHFVEVSLFICFVIDFLGARKKRTTFLLSSDVQTE